MLHGQRQLAGAVEVVPGIYTGGQETAVAEVATGGLSQVQRGGGGVMQQAARVFAPLGLVAGAALPFAAWSAPPHMPLRSGGWPAVHAHD
jgi:hypothetical protein